MFGRPGPKRFPIWLRLPIGIVFFAVGALLVLMEAGVIGDPRDLVRENQLAGYIAGVAFAVVGMLLLLGAFTGVDDYGNRPAKMGLATRLLLDAAGYVSGLGFAAMLGFIGLDAGFGDAGIFPRVAFCGFAILFGALSVYALARAVFRAVRGLPYDDGHHREATGE
jgi:hypothetical protein